jgi:hypothetical protein
LVREPLLFTMNQCIMTEVVKVWEPTHKDLISVSSMHSLITKIYLKALEQQVDKSALMIDKF